MKVMMIFDQTQAGLGGKESPDLPMGGKPMAIGSCGMFQRFMDQNDGKVIATLWCGDGTLKRIQKRTLRSLRQWLKIPTRCSNLWSMFQLCRIWIDGC